MKRLASAQVGADRCDVKLPRFYDMIRDGIIPPGAVVRLGRQIKVDMDRLDEFLAGGGQALPGGWRRERDAA